MLKFIIRRLMENVYISSPNGYGNIEVYPSREHIGDVDSYYLKAANPIMERLISMVSQDKQWQEYIVSLIAKSDYRIKRGAIWIAACIQLESLPDILVKMLTEDKEINYTVMDDVAEVLGIIGKSSAVKPLMEHYFYIQSKDKIGYTEENVLREIKKAVGRLAPEIAESELNKFIIPPPGFFKRLVLRFQNSD